MATNPAPVQGPAPAQGDAGVRHTITFVMPPPVTVWFQFDDGSRIAMTPTPERLASSILGMPLFGGLPFVVPGLGGLFGGAGGLESQIHELFMRSQSEQHGPPPTSKAFLEKIPLKTWDSKLKETEKHTDCPICLCDYEDKDEVLPLPCGHQFHKDCGMKWLLEHNVCPTCRYALPVQENANTAKPAETVTPAANTNPASTSSPASQPEQEPESEDDLARVNRVRQRSPRREPERLVRRRLSDRDALVLPGSVASNDDELDSILEEEATRFIAEERQKQEAADITFDDVDVEELLHDTSS